MFLIVLLSALSHILVGFLGIRDRYPLLYEAFYTFIVLALVEEIVKFRVSRRCSGRRTILIPGWM